MASKKKVISGFTVFLREQKEVYAKKGFSMSMEEAVNMFNPRYKGLPPAEKEVYEARAKREKDIQKSDPNRIFDAYGVSLAQRAAEQQTENRIRNEMISDIRKTLKEKRDLGELEQHFFYIGHLNYTVVTDEKDYIPCEIAIARFSLDTGVQSVYHCMIQPGPIPTGYSYTAKEHSEKTHQIPPDGLPGDSDSSYSGQVVRMTNFLKNGVDENKTEPIYFLQTEMEPAKAMISYIFGKGAIYRQPPFKVYDLNKLFHELVRDTGKDFALEEHADSELKSDRFDYEYGIACKFHEPLDNPKFCSRHYVFRWAFIISDYCSEPYSIRMKPGHHFPKSTQAASVAICGWGEEEEEEEEQEQYFQQPANRPRDISYSSNNNVQPSVVKSSYGREAPLADIVDPEENGWSVAGSSRASQQPRMVVKKPTSQGSISARMQASNWSQNSAASPSHAWGQSQSGSQSLNAPPGFGRSSVSAVQPAVGRGRGAVGGITEDLFGMSLGGKGRGRGSIY